MAVSAAEPWTRFILNIQEQTKKIVKTYREECPHIFVSDLQDANKKLVFYVFYAYKPFEGIFLSFVTEKKS